MCVRRSWSTRPGGASRHTDDSAPDAGSPAPPPSFGILQNDPSDAIHVGMPFTDRRDGDRTFALSRRLATADGQFAGIVLARVSSTTWRASSKR